MHSLNAESVAGRRPQKLYQVYNNSVNSEKFKVVTKMVGPTYYVSFNFYLMAGC